VCSKCGAQVIVTKAGNGSLQCCGQPMEQKK
jgi:desulfoferrodoxin-like iron-binding protein